MAVQGAVTKGKVVGSVARRVLEVEIHTTLEEDTAAMRECGNYYVGRAYLTKFTNIPCFIPPGTYYSWMVKHNNWKSKRTHQSQALYINHSAYNWMDK
jgi:hypothetical protein